MNWYKPPPLPVLTAGRAEPGHNHVSLSPLDVHLVPMTNVPSVATYAGAKYRAMRAAAHHASEHWATDILEQPSHPLNRRTVRSAGKPYHWRQDYTGQLKLRAGVSPW